jgi:aspartate aminotransferase
LENGVIQQRVVLLEGHTGAGAAGKVIETDADFAMACLEESHVALVSGASFGMSPYLRISYATDDASLEEAMSRMAKFVSSLA